MNNSIAKAKITVVINFYNMRREAVRTLHSLSANYQQAVSSSDYNVFVIENGSTEPLDEAWVKGLGENFHYEYFKATSPSPAVATNYAINKVETELVMCCIDGARILSPGVLKYTLAAAKLHDHPFIYTMGMHLGPHLQNYTMVVGYNQEIEDKLLSQVNWQKNGYELFTISSIAESSKDGFYSKITESNCFSMKKSDFLSLGGFDERFKSPGGGVINHDLFNKVHTDRKFTPVMLLGEATFHQFHHGVATNVPMDEHPAREMMKEYEVIKGIRFSHIHRSPEYYGWLSPEYHSKLMKIGEEKRKD